MYRHPKSITHISKEKISKYTHPKNREEMLSLLQDLDRAEKKYKEAYDNLKAFELLGCAPKEPYMECENAKRKCVIAGDKLSNFRSRHLMEDLEHMMEEMIREDELKRLEAIFTNLKSPTSNNDTLPSNIEPTSKTYILQLLTTGEIIEIEMKGESSYLTNAEDNKNTESQEETSLASALTTITGIESGTPLSGETSQLDNSSPTFE